MQLAQVVDGGQSAARARERPVRAFRRGQHAPERGRPGLQRVAARGGGRVGRRARGGPEAEGGRAGL
eukprot:1558828-Pyramimonas_sp.AAC.1